MSFSKVDRLFGNEDFCKSLGDADKRDIFNDTIGRVRRKREEDAKELRQKCRAVLADLLDSLPDISYRTTWAEAHRVISSCNAFTEHPELKRMHKLEMLEAFGDYIRKAEKHHMDEREQDQKMFRREERKIRDAFHGLMNELQQKGNLLSTSKWTQIYPIIRQDNRFTSMLQQPGSTPLDVFKFYVDDLKNSYNKDRKRVRDIMQKLDFHVTINMPFSEFEEKVRAEDKDNEIDTANLNIYFTSQLDKCAMPNENANVEDDGEIVDELAGETPSKEKKAKKQKKSKKEGKKSKKEKKRKREKEEESISDKEEGEV
jgi:pre-mRNA-processing factor 40